jgi:3-methyladenine DNA glycosylase Mpg
MQLAFKVCWWASWIAAVYAVVQSSILGSLAFTTLIAFAYLFRCHHLEAALDRADDTAARSQQAATESRRQHFLALARIRIWKHRSEDSRALAADSEAVLIKVVAMWANTIRPTTAHKYAEQIMTLGGDPAALASAMMLARAAQRSKP